MAKKRGTGIIATLAVLQDHIRQNKRSAAVYFVLRALIILVMIRAIFRRDYEAVFVCVLSLLLLLAPAFVERRLRIDLPTTFEIIAMVFVFAAEILGELGEYYVKYPHWDTILHTTNGFLCAAIGFGLVDILNRAEGVGLQLTPLYMAIASFCFAMTIGVLWEFFEFAADCLMHTDMQKDTVIHAIYSVSLNPTGANKAVGIDPVTSVLINGQDLGLGGYLDIGLYDTMEDLFVNFIGATVFSVIGYFYAKSGRKKKFAKRFIPTVAKETSESAAGSKKYN
jgi:hypothetical protein